MKSLINIFISSILILSFYGVQGQINDQEFIDFEIYTGEETDDGTDMLVSIVLYPENGNPILIFNINDYISGNAFGRADIDKFSYKGTKIESLEKIRIMLSSASTRDYWYLKKINVKLANGKKYTFQANQGLRNRTDEEIYFWPSVPSDGKAEVSTYSMAVEVKTTNISGGGTNANIYMTLKTENGDGPPLKLNTRLDGDAFEAGDVDKFKTSYDYFTDLKSINIWHDNKGVGSGWHLTGVKITTPNNKVAWFECNCWMEGDGNGKTLTANFKHDNEEKAIYFKSAVGEKYLDVQWGHSTNNTPLHLWNSNKGKAQQFFLEEAGDNYYYIRSAVGDRKYLHTKAGKSDPKTEIVIWGGKGSDNSLWSFERAPNSDNYLIKSKLGNYMDVQWGEAKDGTPIWLWTKNGGKAQQWKLMYDLNGTLRPTRL